MVAFLRDKQRGAVLIQSALFLPVLITFLMGAFEIWKVLYVKESLQDAAYQGIRLICMQPRDDIENQADALMRRTMLQNRFVAREVAEDPERFTITFDPPPSCGADVRVTLRLERSVAWQGWAGWWRRRQLPTSGWLTTSANGVVRCDILP